MAQSMGPSPIAPDLESHNWRRSMNEDANEAAIFQISNPKTERSDDDHVVSVQRLLQKLSCCADAGTATP